jgi:hypothetical protein
MAPTGAGGAAALFLGFIGFVVIVISIILLSQKPSTSPAPAPEVGQASAPEVGQASAPEVGQAPAPESAQTQAPAPAPAPLVFGSITPRGPAPAPAPIIQQVFTTTPSSPPYDTPLDKLLVFLTGIPDMLLTRQNLVLAIADLIINRQKSMVYELVKGMFQKIARVPALSMKIKASIERRVAARTATGAIRGKFKFMSLLERARLGLSWNKTSAKLGENTGAKLTQEAGTRFNVAGALGKATAQSARATVSAGKLAGGLARGLVTDPLMVAAVIGMALDSKNVGNFAQLTQTSDMLVERNSQLKIVAETTVDCSANPLGPKCPPSPGAAPAPGPAPPPKAGRFPRFLGPHDLMPVEAMFADLETNILSLVGDPSDPKGGLKTTIDMIPSSTYLDVKNSLTALYNSIDITNPAVDGVLSPFIYTSPASQTIVQNAINTLKSKPKTTLLDVLINRLEIIFLMQGIVSNYIAQIRGNNYGDITLADFQQLVMTPLSDAVLDGLVDSMLDFNCVQNGGLVFNPGNGYDAHTCTWATKQDCHGAFPWALTDGTVIDDATQRTKAMMCTTTCPAPCPAGSPAPCPPPVSCPAPSPCAAISDPSKLDLTYTEWRSKDWFSKANWISSNPAWNAALDQNAIPSGGACIAADAGVHSFCDDTQTTTAGSANNIYIRDTGTCVNSRKLCDIKGVSYDGNMDASKLGGGNVENANYPSCYVGLNQRIAEDILGSTWVRFVNSGEVIRPIIEPVNSGNPVVDTVLNTLGQGLATAAGDIATGAAYGVAGVVTGTIDVVAPAIVNVATQTLVQTAGTQSGGVVSAITSGNPTSAIVNLVTGGATPLPPCYGLPFASYNPLTKACEFADLSQMFVKPPELWEHATTPLPPGVTDAVLPTYVQDKLSTPCPSNTGERVSINGGSKCLSCPTGYTLSENGAWCYKCPSGFNWVNNTLGCTPPTTITSTKTPATQGSGPDYWGNCPSSFKYDTNYDVCVKCPTGSVLTSQWPDGPMCRSCPSGYSLSSDPTICNNNNPVALPSLVTPPPPPPTPTPPSPPPQPSCRADQVRDVSGKCVCGGSKPIDFGTYCGTTANCPACTGGKVQKGTTSCFCECPSGYYDDNGTCRIQGSCPPGKMYTSTGRPMSASDCVTACSGATPVWNPDTQTCVAAASCPPGKPYVSPPTDRIAVPGITNVSFCSTGCEGTINGMTAFADETTRTCVGTCPSGTTIDFLTKKCVGQGACPPAKPWYDINATSCLNDTELGLFGEAKYQSVGSNPGKLGVCAQGKKKNTGTTGGLCVPIASGEKDQMTDVIGKYGWNIQGIGNDTAAAAYCSANGGALMNPNTCSTCGAGQYVNPSTGQCTACPADTYKTGNGWKLSDCLACQSGTYTNGATGQTSSAGCLGIPCPVGQIRSSPTGPCFTPISSCPAGQTKDPNGGNFCTACAVGTYKSDTSINACTPCAPGTKATGTGSTSCSPIYTKYTNTNVPNFDNYSLTYTQFRAATGRNPYVYGSLNDAYNACDNLPGCAGFSRQNLVYSLNTVKTPGNDSTSNYTVLLSSATAAQTRTGDSKYDFYKKN